MSIPTSGAAEGTMSEITIVTRIGKISFSTLETGLSSPITTERSFFVVRAFMIGGWIIGTRAIYV